ncbi:hypothetical protein BDSB_28350 [Burkholderia dolosa PC543]|nr:hypothetical protein BDSB_28350 [Burkholderia dolosa PC543]
MSRRSTRSAAPRRASNSCAPVENATSASNSASTSAFGSPRNAVGGRYA